ncbi:glycosyltransferase family 52 [Phocaeicola vulgatus]|jgi:hypothetical protein|uniref:Lipooligosaccharide sialyltransferase n=1 Tax=Phocaeicola vulgatus TaxID=821 RepID=A0A412Q8K3_PHOVU|nr:glycosyltransferase family 52 [Phocaeicola vulgatus]RGT86415.1 hypothetical protein DWX04_21300 [Phocaeicola vulgatus]
MTKKKYKFVCVVDTVFSLMYYVLLNNRQVVDTYFFFSDGIPANIRMRFPHTFLKKADVTMRSIIIFRSIVNKLKIQIQYMKQGLSGLVIWGQDHLFISGYFVSTRSEPFYLLEDGLANYTFVNTEKQQRFGWVKCLVGRNGGYLPWGVSNRIERIFLTGLCQIPVAISDKVVIKPILPLWKQLNENEKANIRNLFNVPSLPVIRNCSILLITQCYSEDKVCSESEKVAYYKKCVYDIPQDLLVIKPHPREVTDYKKIFPNALVLDKCFPLELLFLSSTIEVNCIYSINSSCALTLSKNFGLPLKMLNNNFNGLK